VSLFLSKLLPIFVYPLGLVIVLACSHWVRGKRIGRAVLGLALVMLWVASTPVSSNWLLGQLEAEYPPVPIETLPHARCRDRARRLDRPAAAAAHYPDLSDAADRVLYGRPSLPGGQSGPNPCQRRKICRGRRQSSLNRNSSLTCWSSSACRRTPSFKTLQSRNTRENAVNSAVIMNAQAWHTALLVTSGAHMPRALAAFRRVGLNVTPAATDIRVVYPLYDSALDFLPDAGALAQTTDAIKEWIGLAVYGVRGWA